MNGVTVTMNPERWERVKKIFEAVISSPSGEREHLVVALCQGDSQLQAEIVKLLAADEHEGSFLEGKAVYELGHLVAERSAQTLQVGEFLANRFDITRFVGNGGMGEVYEAWDCELRQKVALKTIRQKIAAHPGVIDRFKAEVKESLRITHPNVCRVYQLALDQSSPGRPIWFLTMELLDGQTLARCLADNGRLPAKRALRLIRQMVSGLACAHQAGIVHRDLKPGNLMLVDSESSRERLVITDFGLAISATSRDEGGMVGTPAYMAPEQFNGGVVGPQADVFALGIIMGEMLTGKRPVLDLTSPKDCARQLRLWLAENSHVPRRLRAIIRRCMQFGPERRFQDASQIAPLLESKRRVVIERVLALSVVAAAMIAIGTLLLPQLGDRIVNESRLTPNNSLSAEPSLSPDGKYLAYISNRADPGHMDIWFQPPSGEPHQLTKDSEENSGPSVSPDGKLVAFAPSTTVARLP